MSATITQLAAHKTAQTTAPNTQTDVSVRLRLTRRGRVVLATLASIAVLLLLALAAVFGSSQAVASAAMSDADFGYVIVQPGDSLWQVAQTIDSSVDPRDLVAEIVQLNQLNGSEVQAGQPIALPLRYAGHPMAISETELGL